MTQQMNNAQAVKQKITVKKVLIAALAVVLVLSIGFLAHFQLLGRSLEANQYIAEVRTYQAKTVQEAQALCKNDGFIPVDGNLNEGSGEDAVIIGYTTTNDKDAALTDIRMMQMTSGFSTINYKELAKRHYPGIDSIVEDQYIMIQEFRKRVKENQYNARIALKFLNVYEIPELKMKLGDYYLSDSLSKDKLKEIFLQTAAVVSTTVTNLLAMSLQLNWAAFVYGRRYDMEIPDDADEEEVTATYENLDRECLEKVDRIIPIIQDFSTKVQNGMASMAANGGTLEKPDVDELSCSEMNEHGTESLYLNALDILNQYPFSADMKLGDWLVEMGNLTLSKISEKENCIRLLLQ